ncbi:MAG: zf-HC2 domain-containing protein [Planctomycetota bacterium]|nr:zf-HC2 domain-containing protein [Planctomycetota bacterium]
MKCKQARAFASLMVGNDLESDSRAQLQRHLAICPDCRDFTHQMSASMSVLQEAGHESALLTQSQMVGRASLWPRVAEAVTQKSLGNLRNRWFNGSVATLAIAATVLAMVSIFQTLNDRVVITPRPNSAHFTDANYAPPTPPDPRMTKSPSLERDSGTQATTP